MVTNLLLPKSSLRIIYSLLALDRAITVRELSKIAEVPLPKCSYFTRALENLGYIRRRPKLAVTDKRLVYLLAYTYPLRAVPFIGFETLERTVSTVQKIAEIGKKEGMNYAFTHIAASEIISPYKFSNFVYFYAEQGDAEKWKENLKKVGIMENRNGSIRLLLSELNPFLGTREINGIKVASPALLYSDLYSSEEGEVAKWISKGEVSLNYGNL